jgi:hypothetical protein
MDEQEFDSLLQWRPFECQDLRQAERIAALAARVWGVTTDHLRRQLLAPSPALPLGFDLGDYRKLQRQAEVVLLAVTKSGAQNQWASLLSRIILVDDQRFTVLEAHCEIVRRAIEYLENHS